MIFSEEYNQPTKKKGGKQNLRVYGQVRIGSVSMTSYKILTGNAAAVNQIIELIKNNDGIPKRMMCELAMDHYI
jgi:hypothetical protein